MTGIVFESYTPTGDYSATIAGVFAPMVALSGQIPSGNRIVGRFGPLTGNNQYNVIGSIQGAFDPVTALVTDAPSSLITGTFGPLTLAVLTDSTFVPIGQVIVGQFGRMTGYLQGQQIVHASIQGAFAGYRTLITNKAKPYAIGQFAPMQALVVRELDYVGQIGINQDPGLLYLSTPNDGRVVVIEFLNVASSVASMPVSVVAENLNLSALTSGQLSGHNHVIETLSMSDMLAMVFKFIVQENINFSATATQIATHANQVVEKLSLIGGAGSHLSAQNAVASALGMMSQIGVGYKNIVTENLVLSPAVKESILAYNAVLEQIVFYSTVANTAHLSAVVSENFNLSDSALTKATFRNMISEGIEFNLRLRLGDEWFSAWVVNPANKAASQYTNFPYNSFARIGQNQYFGCADDGIYQLTGTDDNGADIVSAVRTGLTNHGTGKLKREVSLYVGFEAQDKVVLKAIVTSPLGAMEEYWYQFNDVATDTSEARVKLGRGLQSVWWQYELTSAAPFNLSTIELEPLVLDRRIRRN